MIVRPRGLFQMKSRAANASGQALRTALILCASAGALYGFATIAKRHGPKLVDFIASRMPQWEWPSLALRWTGSVLEQALALGAIAIFWAFLLSPLLFRIGRRDKPEEAGRSAVRAQIDPGTKPPAGPV